MFSRASTRPGSLWWKRMRCCIRCPIYDAERKTCGYTRNVDYSAGCFCLMVLKNKLPNAGCWLWEKSFGEVGHDFTFANEPSIGLESGDADR